VRFVNRAVLVLRARLPYFDWANRCAEGAEAPAERPESSAPGRPPGRVTLDDARSAGSAFLIPMIDRDDEARHFVAQHARALFEHELSMWTDDRSLWPPERDADAFREWFDVEVHDILVDVGEGPLLAEELE
jgi:hypothetical protein